MLPDPTHPASIEILHNTLDDMLEASGSKVEGSSPIQSFPNFEQLEFRGTNDKYLQPFLQAMAKLAEQRSEGHQEDGCGVARWIECAPLFGRHRDRGHRRHEQSCDRAEPALHASGLLLIGYRDAF